MHVKSLTLALITFSLCASSDTRAQCGADQLTHEIIFDKVPMIGGGDADVFTKPGRQTHVSVTTGNLTNHGGYVTIQVTYSVEEGQKNNTHLQRSENFRLEAPKGCVITSFGDGRSAFAVV